MKNYGYIEAEFKRFIKRHDIIDALRAAGIKQGDVLYVHSSLSACGPVDGGAETIIDAILETVGTNGTVFFPAFTYPFIQFDGHYCFASKYKPFDPFDFNQIWVGEIPKAFMARNNVVRSAHATHSSAGLGPKAQECLIGEKEGDPPAGENSVFATLRKLDGKIVFLGCPENAFTLLHHVEMMNNLPGCGEAVCKIKNPDGSLRTLVYPKHLPGHRDFYNKPFSDTKIGRELHASGVDPQISIMGLSEIKVYNAEAVYRIAEEAAQKDPYVFLCDDADCFYCSSLRINANAN